MNSQNKEEREEVEIRVTNVKGTFKDDVIDKTNGLREELFDEGVKKMEAAADVLDCYDDFSSLKISGNVYATDESGNDTYGYGIHYKREIHQNENKDVILKHQKNAATRFLRDLRGFGLLADVVGSGKTFEAGVILSELAYRGKIGTMLVVAPNEVINSWRTVLTKDFGLGTIKDKNGNEEDALLAIRKGDDNTRWTRIPIYDGKPTRPVIVDMDVFEEWARDNARGNDYFSQNYRFDIIIVDEAHKMCKSADNSNGTKSTVAMGLLSRMIKKNRSMYCLLLSATPHDGDLESMFGLWYFVRRKGGKPSDFEVDSSSRNSENLSPEYKEEYRLYKEYCYGADNISDFIRKKTISDFKKLEGDPENKSESALRIAFNEFLKKRCLERNKKFDITDIDDYDNMDKSGSNAGSVEWKKYGLIEKFLNSEGNEKIREKEEKSIADSYRNLLERIMVRQSRKDIQSSAAKKKTVNVFFYPVKPDSANGKFDIVSGMVKYRVDYSNVYKNFPDSYYPQVYQDNGQVGCLNEVLMKKAKGDGSKFKNLYKDYVDGLFSRLNSKDFSCGKAFRKGYDDFYSKMLVYDDTYEDNVYEEPNKAKGGQFNLHVPFGYSGEESSFDNKMKYTEQILRKHCNERVIIFFDYELESNSEKEVNGKKIPSLYDKVEKKLGEKFRDRPILTIDNSEKEADEIKEKFDDENNNNCILLVKNGFTHGANLQKAAVIINFQVTCSPVEMDQRIGRIFRLGQERDVTIYSLADMSELEGYALAYFTKIGLFAVDNGDAIILSGCNSSKMVTVRCRDCGMTKMMTEGEYNAYSADLELNDGMRISSVDTVAKQAWATRKNDASAKEIEVKYDGRYANSEIVCEKPWGKDNRYHRMDRISSDLYVCESGNPTHKFMRGKKTGGYHCMNTRGASRIMCSTGIDETRTIFCKKICAVSNCDWHRRNFPNCEAVKVFEKDENVCDAKLLECCKRCTDAKRCESGYRGQSCKLSNKEGDLYGTKECVECGARNSDSAEFYCSPRPYIVKFDEDWSEAACPICERENRNRNVRYKLKRQEMTKFSDHIRYLWGIDEDDGGCFCEILTRESDKVSEVKRIIQRSSYDN